MVLIFIGNPPYRETNATQLSSEARGAVTHYCWLRGSFSNARCIYSRCILNSQIYLLSDTSQIDPSSFWETVTSSGKLETREISSCARPAPRMFLLSLRISLWWLQNSAWHTFYVWTLLYKTPLYSEWSGSTAIKVSSRYDPK